MAIECDNCGRENEDEFKFCLGCGSALSSPQPTPEPTPDKVNCPSCGMEVPTGFKFCGACGTSLADVQPDAGGGGSAQPDPQPQSQPQTAASAEGDRLGELTVIRPDGSEGARIPLTTGGIVLGRNSDFEVLANDPFLAPSHAEIRHEGGQMKLRSLDDINGVFWRLRDDVELQDGDLIRIGQELLRYREFSNVEPLEPVNGSSEVKAQGSPDPGAWGRLSLVGGPDVETRAFALSGREVTIGRELGAILFNDDGFVSGKHAKIYRDNGKVFLRDLGSSNGSYIRIRRERQLTGGDLVLMGQQLLRVSL